MDAGLDKLDRKIMAEYLGDARLSCREVARRVGTSTATVLSRLRRLEKEGIIKGYTVLLDCERIGYTVTAITEVMVSGGRLIEMEKEIARMTNTMAVYDVTGEADAVIISKFRNMDELSTFIKRLLALPYVERTNTHIALTSVKEDFRLSP
ncbi:MAG: Lrp/AsnC family transcriptional regulator [Candidatus Bathyarchaeia archaeon]